MSEEKFHHKLCYRYLPDLSNLRARKIYVGTVGSNRFYELDYDLCIPQGSTISHLNKFVDECSTYKELFNYMNHKRNFQKSKRTSSIDEIEIKVFFFVILNFGFFVMLFI